MTTFKINGQQIQDDHINLILSNLKSKSASQAVRDVLIDDDIEAGEVLVLVNPATESGVAVVDHEDWKKVNSNFQTIGLVSFGDLALYLRQKFPNISYQITMNELVTGEEFNKFGFKIYRDNQSLCLKTPLLYPNQTPVIFYVESANQAEAKLTTLDIQTSEKGYQLTFYTNYEEKFVVEIDPKNETGNFILYTDGKKTAHNENLKLSVVPPIPKIDAQARPTKLPQASLSLNTLLLRVLNDKKEVNPLVSSFSLQSAFGMLALGLQDSDYKTQAGLLGLNSDKKEEIKKFSNTLRSLMAGNNEGFKLQISNTAYSLPSSFTEAYKRLVNAYGAKTRELDFQNDPQGATQAINEQIARDTEGQIQNLLEELSPDTVFALVNVINLDGKWEKPFDLDKTNPEIFTTSKRKEVKIPTMYQRNDFPYLKNKKEGYQAVSLPYEGGRFSMVVVLPDLGSDFHPQGPDYLRLLESMAPKEIGLSLPRFSAETTIILDDVAQDMGLNGLDYSRMTTQRVDQIQGISKIIGRVSEEGTKMAAASVVAGKKDVARPDPQLTYFTVDHPFYYAVVDSVTGVVLFEGRMDDPTKN